MKKDYRSMDLEASREEINSRLEEYTDKYCSHVYAQISKSFMIHIDGQFDVYRSLTDIMDILSEWEVATENLKPLTNEQLVEKLHLDKDEGSMISAPEQPAGIKRLCRNT